MSDPIHYILSRPATFDPGAYISSSLDADAVKREYLRAAQPNGQIDWSDVLDLASDPTSALHDAIDWDDATAAEKQRRGVIVAIAWALRDAGTGERLFESLRHQTRNPEDTGRLRINVRLLPLATVSTPQRYVVQTRAPQVEPSCLEPQARVDTSAPEPPQTVVDYTPEEDRALTVFRRWVDAHRHDPSVLRAALRILYDTL